jgi:hypothetical protein
MSQIYWSFLYFAVLALWIGGAVVAILRLSKRDHTPVWAIVLIGVAMFVLPVVTAVYWLVVAILRLSRGGRPPAASPAFTAPAAWPPPNAGVSALRD